MAGGTARRIDATTALAGGLMVFAWGTSSVATKVGLDSYEPGPWTLLRFAITCAVMIVWALATRMRLPARRDVLPIIGLGIIGITLNQMAFTYGVRTVDPGTTTFLLATVPVIAALLGRAFLGERLTGPGWTGITLTVIGTAVLTLGNGQEVSYTRSAIILLGGAFCEACYYILQKPFLRRYTAVEVSTWALIASTLPLVIYAPRLPDQLRAAPAEANWAVLYVALGAGVTGYVCMSIVNSRMPATIAAVLMAGMPVVAMLASWAYLDLVPTWLSAVGGALSIAGLLLVTVRGAQPTIEPTTERALREQHDAA